MSLIVTHPDGRQSSLVGNVHNLDAGAGFATTHVSAVRETCLR
jgi:hypothetical protein